MAVYAIGDVQGCHDELVRLLDVLKVDPARTNSGSSAISSTAARARSTCCGWLNPSAVPPLSSSAITTCTCWLSRSPVAPASPDDDLREVLEAPDRAELIDWLRAPASSPLPAGSQHADGARRRRAGMGPAADGQAGARSRVRTARPRLRAVSPRHVWQPAGSLVARRSPAIDRLRFIVNCLTRIRYCHADGRLDFDETGPPGTQPARLVPWFELPGQAAQAVRIVFGHWSSLGSPAAGEPARPGHRLRLGPNPNRRATGRPGARVLRSLPGVPPGRLNRPVIIRSPAPVYPCRL